MTFGEHKKLYIGFGVLCCLLFILVIRQLYLVGVVSTQRESESIVSTETYPITYTKKDPSYGNPGAPAIVAIFSDMSCTECQRIVNEVYNFVAEHPRDIRLVWFDAPKQALFADRTLPHKAARCASEQDMFWPYIQKTFGVRGNHERGFLEEAAERIGLDTQRWSNCLMLKETMEAIQRGSEMFERFELGSLPAVFINNKRVTLVKGISISSILSQVITPLQ